MQDWREEKLQVSGPAENLGMSPIKFTILWPDAGDAPQMQAASRREESLPSVACAPRVAVCAAAGGVCMCARAISGAHRPPEILGNINIKIYIYIKSLNKEWVTECERCAR